MKNYLKICHKLCFVFMSVCIKKLILRKSLLNLMNSKRQTGRHFRDFFFWETSLGSFVNYVTKTFTNSWTPLPSSSHAKFINSNATDRRYRWNTIHSYSFAVWQTLFTQTSVFIANIKRWNDRWSINSCLSRKRFVLQWTDAD